MNIKQYGWDTKENICWPTLNIINKFVQCFGDPILITSLFHMYLLAGFFTNVLNRVSFLEHHLADFFYRWRRIARFAIVVMTTWSGLISMCYWCKNSRFANNVRIFFYAHMEGALANIVNIFWGLRNYYLNWFRWNDRNIEYCLWCNLCLKSIPFMQKLSPDNPNGTHRHTLIVF